jgi:hypothetical protein
MEVNSSISSIISLSTLPSPSESPSWSDLRWRVSTLTSMQLAGKLAWPSDLPISWSPDFATITPHTANARGVVSRDTSPPELVSLTEIEGVDRYFICKSIFKLSTATILSSKFGMLTC